MKRKLQASGTHAIPNPLAAREPQLVEFLSAQRIRVYDALLDALATASREGSMLRSVKRADTVEELKATALILRMLTKPSWDEADLSVFEDHWRAASGCAAFAEEFESERFRIRHNVDAARSELIAAEQLDRRDERSTRAVRTLLDNPQETCYASPCYAQPSLFNMKTYHGTRNEHGTTVQVEENGQLRDLDPRLDLRRHSMSGFEWGYSGSGPAQLALALAADVLGDDEKAQALYQRLKFKIVGGLPHQGWSLTEDRLRAALQAIEQEKSRTP